MQLHFLSMKAYVLYIENHMPKKRLYVALLLIPPPNYTQNHPHASKVMMLSF